MPTAQPAADAHVHAAAAAIIHRVEVRPRRGHHDPRGQAVQKAMTAESWHALLARLGSLEHWPVGSREFGAVVAADTEYFRANLGLLAPAQ